MKSKLFGLPTDTEMMSAIKENTGNIKDSELRTVDGFDGKKEYLFWSPVKNVNQVAYTKEDAAKLSNAQYVITVDPQTGSIFKKLKSEWGGKMVGVVKPEEAMGTQDMPKPIQAAPEARHGVGAVVPKADLVPEPKLHISDKQVPAKDPGQVGSVKPSSTFKSKIPAQLDGLMYDFTVAVTEIVKSAK